MVTDPASLRVSVVGGGGWQEVVPVETYILDPDYMVASAPIEIEWKLASETPTEETPADFLAGEKEIELNRSKPALFARSSTSVVVDVVVYWETQPVPTPIPVVVPFHNATQGLQGGSATERYHLTSAQHSTLTTNTPNFDDLVIAQYLKVGGTGCDFTKVQDAIDSITDATITKQYLVEIYPGDYYETVVGKPYVHLKGVSSGTGLVKIISNTIPFTVNNGNDALATYTGIQFVSLATTDGCSAVDVTGTAGFADVFFAGINSSSDVEFIAAKLNPGAGGVCAIQNCSVELQLTHPGRTKNIKAVQTLGAGQIFVARTAVRGVINQDSGITCLFNIAGTGEVFSDSTGVSLTNQSLSSAAWVCRGMCTDTVSSSVRVFASSDWRFYSNGGGKFVGSYLNTGGGAGEIQNIGMTFSVRGFTPGQEFATETAATDHQLMWLQSTNRDLGKDGTGIAIITPYDEAKSGFVAWGPGTDYWAYNNGTKKFTVTRAVSGVVRSSPVLVQQNQETTLSANYVTHFIYADSDGILRNTTTAGEALYANNIVLFEVYPTASDKVVVKENHPLKFPPAVSAAWHGLFGVLLRGTGAVATILSGANRTIRIVGADVLTDHGLDTTIPDSGGVAVNWRVVYTTASGSEFTAEAAALPGQWNNGNTLANTSDWVVFRLAVTKDSLNSGSPQYLARAHTAAFANQAAARTAANANNIALFSDEILKLEIAQLGFAIVNGNGAGAGTLAEIVMARQTFLANFLSVAAASSAALVNTDTSAFDGMLGPSDTSAQLCFNTIDNWVKAGVMKVPSVTTTVRNTITHSDGLILLDTTDGKVYVSIASAWVALN